jgi:uncharacterized secreted protein with C-terminal beta-propeller domain
VALFDVSDVANPQEKAKYILGGQGSDSIALRDHKAFLFDKDKHLLVLPVTLRNEINNFQSRPIPMDEDFVDEVEIDDELVITPRKKRVSPQNKHFVGAAVFEIDDENIDLRGKISHSKNSSDDWCVGDCYNDNILRSLWIGDTLYTFSNKFLQANQLSTLDKIKKIKLEKKSEEDDFQIVN